MKRWQNRPAQNLSVGGSRATVRGALFSLELRPLRVSVRAAVNTCTWSPASTPLSPLDGESSNVLEGQKGEEKKNTAAVTSSASVRCSSPFDLDKAFPASPNGPRWLRPTAKQKNPRCTVIRRARVESVWKRQAPAIFPMELVYCLEPSSGALEGHDLAHWIQPARVFSTARFFIYCERKKVEQMRFDVWWVL